MRAGLQKWTVLTKVIKINSRRQKGKLFLSTDIYTIRKNSAQICDIIRNICLSLFSTDLPAPPSQLTPNTSNSSLSTSLFNTPSALLCSIIIAIKARGKKEVQCAQFNNLGQLMMFIFFCLKHVPTSVLPSTDWRPGAPCYHRIYVNIKLCPEWSKGRRDQPSSLMSPPPVLTQTT